MNLMTDAVTIQLCTVTTTVRAASVVQRVVDKGSMNGENLPQTAS